MDSDTGFIANPFKKKLMKKKITLLFLLFSSALIGYSQTPDCIKFKTARFSYRGVPNKTSLRKDSTQESFNHGKLEMLWKIKWLSECQYEMTCEKMLVVNSPIEVGDRILATIIKTEGECYTASSTYYNKANPRGIINPEGKMCIVKAEDK